MKVVAGVVLLLVAALAVVGHFRRMVRWRRDQLQFRADIRAFQAGRFDEETPPPKIEEPHTP